MVLSTQSHLKLYFCLNSGLNMVLMIEVTAKTGPHSCWERTSGIVCRLGYVIFLIHVSGRACFPEECCSRQDALWPVPGGSCRASILSGALWARLRWRGRCPNRCPSRGAWVGPARLRWLWAQCANPHQTLHNYSCPLERCFRVSEPPGFSFL